MILINIKASQAIIEKTRGASKVHLDHTSWKMESPKTKKGAFGVQVGPYYKP